MKKVIYFLSISLLTVACGDTFLDEKPRSTLVVPHTLKDFEQLLNNGSFIYFSSELLDILADDYYMKYDYWENLGWTPVIKNSYVWAKEIYEGEENRNEWVKPYNQVFYANIVLEGLQGIEVNPNNQGEWERIKGTALFLRALAMYNLAQLFAPAYNPETAPNDVGLPIRNTSNVHVKVERSTVKETYEQILSDLYVGEKLLPPNLDYTRPSRQALLALLARVHLNMGDFGLALHYATICKEISGELTDFNTLITFPGLHGETFYLSNLSPQIILSGSTRDIIIDTTLFGSYHDHHDLRKQLYFRINEEGYPNRYGGTQLVPNFFTGLALDEIYLMLAECKARLSDWAGGLVDLTTLLEYRYVTGTFALPEIKSQQEALDYIAAERRKELIFRGIRWGDLKRYNVLGMDIGLTRELNGKTYHLEPNSPRWVMPIPDDEIRLGNIVQNER